LGKRGDFGSVMPILSIGVRWGRVINWVCKPEATGSIPARSTSRSGASVPALHTAAVSLEPLEVLYDAQHEAPRALPDELTRLYGGGLGFEGDRVIANFVSTLDGVVAIPSVPQSNKLVSRGSEADRFVMGLLRACADAVVVGSGTFHDSPQGLWTPEGAYPELGEVFAELRRARGMPPVPELAVLTASGSLDVEHPALERGALVLSSAAGEERLQGRLPAASTTVSSGEDGVDVRWAIDVLRERGHSLILSEAGPHVFGSMVDAGVVDELFLTLSPLLAGHGGQSERLHLVEGAELLPGLEVTGEITSVRKSGAHLFLRYALARRE